MHFQDFVPLLEGFFEFGRTPSARESAFFRGVRSSKVPLVQGTLEFRFGVGATKGKDQFVLTWVRQIGVIQFVRRFNGAFDESKDTRDVLAFGLRDDGRMSDGVRTAVVDVGVQEGVVVAKDCLPFFRLTKQLDGIGTPAKGSIERFQTGLQLQGVKKVLNGSVVFLLHLPLTFPHFHELVPSITNKLTVILRELINLLHAHVIVFAMQLVLMRKTRETVVIKTTLEFIDGE